MLNLFNKIKSLKLHLFHLNDIIKNIIELFYGLLTNAMSFFLLLNKENDILKIYRVTIFLFFQKTSQIV